MIKVSMNIGGGNGTSYNKIPMFWEFESIRTFTDFIRENMFNILLYSHDNYGIKSKRFDEMNSQEVIRDMKLKTILK